MFTSLVFSWLRQGCKCKQGTSTQQFNRFFRTFHKSTSRATSTSLFSLFCWCHWMSLPVLHINKPTFSMSLSPSLSLPEWNIDFAALHGAATAGCHPGPLHPENRTCFFSTFLWPEGREGGMVGAWEGGKNNKLLLSTTCSAFLRFTIQEIVRDRTMDTLFTLTSTPVLGLRPPEIWKKKKKKCGECLLGRKDQRRREESALSTANSFRHTC